MTTLVAIYIVGAVLFIPLSFKVHRKKPYYAFLCTILWPLLLVFGFQYAWEHRNSTR